MRSVPAFAIEGSDEATEDLGHLGIAAIILCGNSEDAPADFLGPQDVVDDAICMLGLDNVADGSD